MSVKTESTAPRADAPASTALARLRRGNLAVLVLLIIESVIGSYVSIYVDVPGADHGGSIGSAISNGPAWLSVHAVLGLLLGLGALGALTQAIMIRRWDLITLSAVGLLAMAFASVAGTGFTSTGDDSASMAMATLTGVAMLCYALNLYLLRSGSERS